MSREFRKSPRQPARLEIGLAYPSGEHQIAVTRDVSDGGMFVLIETQARPILGELVTISLIGRSANQLSLPSTEAVVVHTSPEGVGLAYIFLELDDDHQ